MFFQVTDINNAILNFDWTGLNMKDRKRYYIILICTQNGFGIKTAVGNRLSLITMTTVRIIKINIKIRVS